MAKKKDTYNEKTITFFSKGTTGRLQADALDIYHWLLIEDKKLAKEFLEKMNKVDKFFEKREKESASWGLGKISYKVEDHEETEKIGDKKVKIKKKWRWFK